MLRQTGLRGFFKNCINARNFSNVKDSLTFDINSFGFSIPEENESEINATNPVVLERLKKVAQQEAKIKAKVEQQKQIELKKFQKKIAKAQALALQKQEQKSVLDDKIIMITEKFVRGSGKGGQSNLHHYYLHFQVTYN